MAEAENKFSNIAFIDGQNLHLGTKESGWKVNHVRLRTYLKDKYKVGEAYYFLGFVSEDVNDLYERVQKAGFILVSGDGDYKRLVDFLIKKNKFGKMLFPNKRFASSLYKSLAGDFFANLDDKDVRAKIEHLQK